jgi:hypothetical protein
MGAGITDRLCPLAALAAGAALLTAAGVLRTMAIARRRRSRRPAAAQERRCGPAFAGRPVVFLILVAEAARSGLQELDRMQRSAAAGAATTQGMDQRGRLPDAVEFVLREPAVTAKSLAGHLRITLQAALRLLIALAKAGVVRETTGRRSFRAFAI